MGRDRVGEKVVTACRKHVWRRAEHSMGASFMQIWWMAVPALNRTRAAPAGRPAALSLAPGLAPESARAAVTAWHRIGAMLRSLGAKETIIAQWSVNDRE